MDSFLEWCKDMLDIAVDNWEIIVASLTSLGVMLTSVLAVWAKLKSTVAPITDSLAEKASAVKVDLLDTKMDTILAFLSTNAQAQIDIDNGLISEETTTSLSELISDVEKLTSEELLQDAIEETNKYIG